MEIANVSERRSLPGGIQVERFADVSDSNQAATNLQARALEILALQNAIKTAA
jgi:hypothetical protein